MLLDMNNSQEIYKTKYKGSIVDPSLDSIMKKVPTSFIAVNIVRKRCNQLNLNKEADNYVTLARLITRVFSEIVDSTVTYEE